MSKPAGLIVCLVAAVILGTLAPASGATFPLVVPTGGEQGNGLIRSYDAGGNLVGSFPSDVPYYGAIPRFGPDFNLYVATWNWYNTASLAATNRARIARYTLSGQTVPGDASPIFYDTLNTRELFDHADSFWDMDFSGRELYVADGDVQAAPANRTPRITRFDIDDLGAGSTDLPALPADRYARGIAFADPDTLYVHATTNAGFSRLHRYQRIAGVWTLDSGYELQGYDGFNHPTSGLVQQGLPLDITFDAAGNLYLLEAGSGPYLPRLIKLTPADYLAGGNLNGASNQYDLVTDLGTDARGLGIGPDGRIYVASYSGTLKSFALDGTDGQVFATVTQGTHLTFIPEPASFALLAGGGLVLLRRKRA